MVENMATTELPPAGLTAHTRLYRAQLRRMSDTRLAAERTLILAEQATLHSLPHSPVDEQRELWITRCLELIAVEREDRIPQPCEEVSTGEPDLYAGA